MLACGHDRQFAREPFGVPVCTHLRTGQEPGVRYLRWHMGAGMDAELLCHSCAAERENGRPVITEVVCEVCFVYATTVIGRLEGVRGSPGIRTRAEPFDSRLRATELPKELGTVIDVAPIVAERRSVWMVLTDDGRIVRFDADTGAVERLTRTNLVVEPDDDPWCDHVLTRHLHSSPRGDFAAVVNDYGRYGQVIDVRSGRVTLALDGGDYYGETVPFSFAFAEVAGRLVAVHRTDWNRLDVSDPATGTLLTARGPTSYQQGEGRPAHYLDYFHGALQVSPNGVHIADDGWGWHPVGAPAAWALGPWLKANVWESDDGPTRKDLCARDYYWDHAMVWIDDARIAIGGIGGDAEYMIDGTRIFDMGLSGDLDPWTRAERVREITTFPGPAGTFFSDGRRLYSSDPGGLSRWDVNDGCRTGYLDGFRPTRQHKGAGELVQVAGGALVRWRIDGDTAP